MSVFYVPGEVAGIGAGATFVPVPQLLVDTGSEFTWIPEATLSQAGVTVAKKDVPFLMANGTTISRATGYAILRASGFETVDEVVFGQPSDLVLLGARTLEGFGATVDSGKRRLAASGPHLAAGAAPASALRSDCTLSDLQRYLGDIPAERIRLDPPPGMATEDDALAIAEREDRIYELVDCVLVEKPATTYGSIVAATLIQRLNNALDLHESRLGFVTAGKGPFWILPTRMRIPDVAFIRIERFPGRKLPRDRVFRVVPNLAVEVLSEGNTPTEMDLKLKEYFEAGVELVWYIDPETRTAKIYTALDECEQIGENGVLDGRDVLPGFRLRLGELFDRTERGFD